MNEPTIRIERHQGAPLKTLDDVRAPFNVVGAYADAEAARAAILELERGGVEPRTISLLGAWPADDPEGRERPVLVSRSAVLAGAVGAVVGALVGYLVGQVVEAIPLSFALAGGAFFGVVLGVPVGWVRATGMSRAWRETFAADATGTVAVGVHTGDKASLDLAEQAMAATGPLAMNRF